MPEVRRYRKKPIEIEGIIFDGSNVEEVRRFTGTHRDSGDQWDIESFNPIGTYMMNSDPEIVAEVWDKLHSTWVGVKVGQLIVRGVEGEFYPVAPSVVEATYDEVSP